MISRILILLLLAVPFAGAETSFEVIHKKRFGRGGRGEIRITAGAIEFNGAKTKNSRRWAYDDIQYFDRISETEFVILSYEDQKWKLGRDRQYRFTLTGGELTDSLFEQISQRIGRPVTNRVVRDIPEKRYELPVKHLHSLGGCEGLLTFAGDHIYYATEHRKDAREWRVSRDVESVWSMNPYQLELHVYDNNRREFSRTRVYRFALKKPLDPEFYRRLKLELYELEATNRGVGP